MLADEVGIRTILVAPSPGTFCALGATVANLRRDFVKSSRIHLDPVVAPAMRAALDGTVATLVAEAKAWMDAVGGRVSGWRFDVSADMRYAGQAFDLTVIERDFRPGAPLAESLAAGFHREHRRCYDFEEPNGRIEITRLVLTAVGLLPQPAPRSLGTAAMEAESTRRAFIEGGWHKARCVRRVSLAPGAELAGPAIVEQDDTTVVVPPGWGARTLGDGALMLTRNA
jgi:N-methylhydantoinase A